MPEECIKVRLQTTDDDAATDEAIRQAYFWGDVDPNEVTEVDIVGTTMNDDGAIYDVEVNYVRGGERTI